MPFEVSIRNGNEFWANDMRPDWVQETKKQLQQSFSQQPFSLLPIATMLSDPEGKIDSLHRRHVIAWNNLKKIVIEIANLDSGTFKNVEEGLKQLFTRMGVPESIFSAIQNANQARNKMPPCKMEEKAKGLTKALKDVYNAVGNVFVGFGRENSRLQASNDDGSDMTKLLEQWKRRVHKVTILGKEHTFRIMLDDKTMNDYIQEFKARTQELINLFNQLRRVVPSSQSTQRMTPSPPTKRSRTS